MCCEVNAVFNGNPCRVIVVDEGLVDGEYISRYKIEDRVIVAKTKAPCSVEVRSINETSILLRCGLMLDLSSLEHLDCDIAHGLVEAA